MWKVFQKLRILTQNYFYCAKNFMESFLRSIGTTLRGNINFTLDLTTQCFWFHKNYKTPSGKNIRFIFSFQTIVYIVNIPVRHGNFNISLFNIYSQNACPLEAPIRPKHSIFSTDILLPHKNLQNYQKVNQPRREEIFEKKKWKIKNNFWVKS